MTNTAMKSALNSELSSNGFTNKVVKVSEDQEYHTVIEFKEPLIFALQTWLNGRYTNGITLVNDNTVHVNHPPKPKGKVWSRAEERSIYESLLMGDSYTRAQFELSDVPVILSNIDNDFSLLMGTSLDVNSKLHTLEFERDTATNEMTAAREELKAVKADRDDLAQRVIDLTNSKKELFTAIREQSEDIQGLIRERDMLAETLRRIYVYHTLDSKREEMDAKAQELTEGNLTYMETVAAYINGLLNNLKKRD